MSFRASASILHRRSATSLSAIPMEPEMILRTWRGTVDAKDGDRYFAYLQETGIEEYKATPGNRGVFVVRRERNGRTEYLLLTLWDSMEAIKRFAGDTPERAVFYPEDDGFLVERDEQVDHYEVLDAPVFVDNVKDG